MECGISGWAPRSWHTITVLSKTPDAIKVREHREVQEIQFAMINRDKRDPLVHANAQRRKVFVDHGLSRC